MEFMSHGAFSCHIIVTRNSECGTPVVVRTKVAQLAFAVLARLITGGELRARYDEKEPPEYF